MSGKPICNSCKIAFETREELMAHYKTELHKTNLVLISRHQPVLTQEQFDTLKAEQEASKSPEDYVVKGKRSKKRSPPPPKSTQQVVEEQPVMEEEDDGQDFNIDECRDIPETECLFCGQTFENADLCYEHMRSHGFYIVYPDRLSDREGLMNFLSEKVGIGNCCLLCSHQFKSIQAVRDHMKTKRHCVYDFDEDVEEFYEPETGIVPVTYTIDEIGELHTPDGMVYGHRKYARYYKQRVPTTEQLMSNARRPALLGPGDSTPVGRESINIERDKKLQTRQYFRERWVNKGMMRIASKDYHPMSDIHRGNGQ